MTALSIACSLSCSHPPHSLFTLHWSFLPLVVHTGRFDSMRCTRRLPRQTTTQLVISPSPPAPPRKYDALATHLLQWAACPPSKPSTKATAHDNARLAWSAPTRLLLCLLTLIFPPLPQPHKHTALDQSSSTLHRLSYKWWLERSTRPLTRPQTLPWRRTASFTSMAARRTPPCPPSLIWPWVPATTKRVS